jgi:cysteine desulfurase
MNPARGAVYLDHNATTRPAPEVVSAMVDAMQVAWANPSSLHPAGQAARRALAQARARVADFLGCNTAELVFTSGATEANVQAVLGALALGRAQGRTRWLLSAVEHPALLALGARLATEGTVVEHLPVGRDGAVDPEVVRVALGADVALVSLMGANNETGVVMPVAGVRAAVQAAGALLHVDATQLVGKAPFAFGACGADLAAVSAHKLHGPKGIGALMVKKGLALPALLDGKQERHRRGGTENMPGIIGFAAACERAAATLAHDLARMAGLRDAFERGIARALPGVHVYGAGAARIANTTCVRFGRVDAEQVLARLERAGILASSGAACISGGTEPSHVLLAMGEDRTAARAAVRFSLGRDTGEDDIEHALAAAIGALAPLLESVPA